jgi:hypothetical protein
MVIFKPQTSITTNFTIFTHNKNIIKKRVKITLLI